MIPTTPFLEFMIQEILLTPLKLPKDRKFIFHINISVTIIPVMKQQGKTPTQNPSLKRKHTYIGTQAERTNTHRHIKVSTNHLIIVPGRSFIGFYF